jgi:Flp pilus assembly protein TadD
VPWFTTGWWTAGPFAGPFEAADEPESAPAPIDSAQADDQAAVGTADHWRWLPVLADSDGYIDVRTLDGNDVGSTYAVQQIHSDHQQTVALLLDTRGQIRIWLDGALVFEQLRRNPSRNVDEAVPITLQPGWNTLLVKLAGDRGSQGMYVDLSRRAAELARAHLSQRNLDAVLQVWQAADEYERRQWRLLALAGEAHARRGRWQDAAVIFRQLVERQPVRNRNWTMLAPLLLQAGDPQAYREHCRTMLDIFGESKLPITMERTAKACLLLPDDSGLLKDAVQLAAGAATSGASHPFVAYFHLADGIGRFRSGQYDEAVRLLELARSRDGDRDPHLSATSLCFLSMACHKLEREQDARRYLEQAQAVFAERLPTLDSGDLGPAWPDWLVCELARREAVAASPLP